MIFIIAFLRIERAPSAGGKNSVRYRKPPDTACQSVTVYALRTLIGTGEEQVMGVRECEEVLRLHARRVSEALSTPLPRSDGRLSVECGCH